MDNGSFPQICPTFSVKSFLKCIGRISFYVFQVSYLWEIDFVHLSLPWVPVLLEGKHNVPLLRIYHLISYLHRYYFYFLMSDTIYHIDFSLGRWSVTSLLPCPIMHIPSCVFIHSILFMPTLALCLNNYEYANAIMYCTM